MNFFIYSGPGLFRSLSNILHVHGTNDEQHLAIILDDKLKTTFTIYKKMKNGLRLCIFFMLNSTEHGI